MSLKFRDHGSESHIGNGKGRLPFQSMTVAMPTLTCLSNGLELRPYPTASFCPVALSVALDVISSSLDFLSQGAVRSSCFPTPQNLPVRTDKMMKAKFSFSFREVMAA